MIPSIISAVWMIRKTIYETDLNKFISDKLPNQYILSKDINYEYQNIKEKNEVQKVIKTYLDKYFDLSDDKQIWFNKMKDLAEELGYAREVKEYKQNPDNYKGHVGDISTVIRIALTGRANTPDMYEIMQVLGKESVEARLNKAIKE